MGFVPMPGIVRSMATRSTSSSTTIDGCSDRAIATAWPSAPAPIPDSRIVVRPVISLHRYMTDSVLPVPGGPYRRSPRLR